MTRREPVQKRSRERVETLLTAAQELIVQDGVEALTTRSLATYTDIPVGTIYRYFSNREAIIAAYLDRDLEAIDRAVAQAIGALERVTLRSLTEAVAMAHLRHHQAHPEGVAVWFGARLNAAVQDRVHQLEERMAHALDTATRSAGFIERGPHFGAGLIVRLFDRMFEHIFRVERGPAQQEAIVREVVDMVCSYMERYALPAGVDEISAADLLDALARKEDAR